MTQASFPTISGMGPVTAQLVELLKVGKPGDTLTDEQLTAHCGRDTSPEGKGYGNLQTAIKHVASSDTPVVWERIRGANAIKCLTGSETTTSVQRDLTSVRRRSYRAVKKLKAIDMGSLSPTEVSKVNVLSAQVGTIAAFAKPDTTKKLEARQVQSVPDMTKFLEVWK